MARRDDGPGRASARRALVVTLGALARCVSVPRFALGSFLHQCVIADSSVAPACVALALAHCSLNASALAFLATMRGDAPAAPGIAATPRLVEARLAQFARRRGEEDERLAAMSASFRAEAGAGVRAEGAAAVASEDILALCADALSWRLGGGGADDSASLDELAVALEDGDAAASGGGAALALAARVLAASVACCATAAVAHKELGDARATLERAVLDRFVATALGDGAGSSGALLSATLAIASGFAGAVADLGVAPGQACGRAAIAALTARCYAASRLDVEGSDAAPLALAISAMHQGIVSPEESYAVSARFYRLAAARPAAAQALARPLADAIAAVARSEPRRDARRAYKARWALGCFEALRRDATTSAAMGLQLVAHLALAWSGASEQPRSGDAGDRCVGDGEARALSVTASLLPTSVSCLPWSVPALVENVFDAATGAVVLKHLLTLMESDVGGGEDGAVPHELLAVVRSAARALAQAIPNAASDARARCAAAEPGAC